MADLNGQYLDSLTLYKGLINIGSTVGQNVTSSLQSLTDGDGNNLPIQVSTSQIIIGGGSSLGRLVVRGDGTNPIVRFENSAGTEMFGINNAGQITQSITILGGIAGGYGAFTIAYTGGVTNNFNSSGSSVRLGMYVTHTAAIATANVDYRSFGTGSTFNPTSGIGTYITALLNPTINQTGGANGITRGLYVAPTLTSAADFRAIDVEAGTTSAHKLIRLANGGGTKVFEVNAASEIGFFNAAPVAQPTITGTRNNPEEALFNLLQALNSLGLVVDTTTA